MPTLLSPGVYVQEVPPLSRPIAGVGTSTPGFIGVIADSIVLPIRPPKGTVDKGKLTWAGYQPKAEKNKPYRVTSWSQYVDLFGDFTSSDTAKIAADTDKLDVRQRYLAHAVYGFFNNGGTSCYVVRVLTVEDVVTIVKELAKIDEISLVAAPGLEQITGLKDYAEENQRFAILDLAVDQKDAVKAISSAYSPYAAIYHPWLQVFDPGQLLLSQNAGKEQPSGDYLVPPSGHVAGVYARSDAERGVFKAPANEALRGISGLAVTLGKADQDALNPVGINVIRPINGAYRIWGARTVGGDANGEYRYVSTRRYFNYLRQSIYNGTQFVVFEPHTPALWQRVIRTLTDFLTNEWRSGALFGETANQAFFIKCDAETNPASEREAGRLIAEIGVAIVKPAEFVIFRIQQSSGA